MTVLKFRMTSVLALALLVGLLASACGPMPAAPATPTPTVAPTVEPIVEPTVEPVDALPGAIIHGVAQVESVDVRILESFPVQVHVGAVGYLGDGCTTLHEINQVRVDNTFVITITTQRPADAMCTMALVGFEENIALDVKDLPAGDYTVEVNGVVGEFNLAVDNTSGG